MELQENYLNTDLAKKYGWKCKTNLDEGIKFTYKDFLKKKYLK
jgi:nucleoside-diphosphate-sugar epimerase